MESAGILRKRNGPNRVVGKIGYHLRFVIPHDIHRTNIFFDPGR